MKRARVSLVAGLATVTAVVCTTTQAPSATAAVPTAAAVVGRPVAPPPAPKKLIGLTASASVYNQRLAAVGACGVEARRIYAMLQSNGKAQSTLIEQTVKAGMMPVISYKVPDVATLNGGGYDAWLKATRTFLEGLHVPVTVTFWHEPYGDVDPAAFRAGSRSSSTW